MSDEGVVLVVDDQKDSRVCVQRILEGAGYRVAAARDGEEALQVLAAEPVDLILCDISMPRMNGYQLFEQVTADTRWVALPFLFLTGRALDSDVHYGKTLGVDAYITKPFRAADLLATVRGRLRRARQIYGWAASNDGEQPGTAEYGADGVYQVGPLTIDARTYTVTISGRDVQLSGREFQLVLHLAEHFGEVVQTEDLVRATHDVTVSYEEAGSLIRPLVRSIRRKLGYEAGEWGCIRNVRGVGYQLVEPEMQE